MQISTKCFLLWQREEEEVVSCSPCCRKEKLEISGDWAEWRQQLAIGTTLHIGPSSFRYTIINVHLFVFVGFNVSGLGLVGIPSVHYFRFLGCIAVLVRTILEHQRTLPLLLHLEPMLEPCIDTAGLHV